MAVKTGEEKGGDKAKRILFKLKLQKGLQNLAIKLSKNPMVECSLRENLTIILLYAHKYPDLFPLTAPLTRSDIQASLEIIKALPKEKIINLFYSTLVEIEDKLVVKEKFVPREIKLSIAEKMHPVFPEDTVSKFKNQFKALYSFEEKEEKKEIKDEKEEISTKSVKELLLEEMEQDYVAGVAQNAQMIKRNNAAKTLLPEGKDDKASISALPELNVDIKELIVKQTKNLAVLKQRIIEMANKLPAPSDPRRVQWELDVAGQERFPLSFEKILHIFLSQDKAIYEQKTALLGAEINELNDLIFQFLIQATKNQQDQRIQSEVDKIIKSQELKSKEEYEAAINKVGLLLDIDRCYKPSAHPEILLFEYLDNKLLFKKQFQYLEEFLKRDEKGQGFNSQAVQLIMGGGKSKVLLPLLALKSATGTNLSIIEVPDALFQVNKADLAATTRKIFGQDAYPFYFNDSINCDIDYLRNLRNQLRSTILNRGYLITTKESMQAFELKYLKYARFMKVENKIDVKTIKLFTEISNIFKYQGDVIIDEIDSTLDVRKQLIYTVGSGTPIPAHELKAVLDLHEFFDKVKISESKAKKSYVDATLKDVLLGTVVPAKSEWPMVFVNLAKALLEHKESPLRPMLDYISFGKSEEELTVIKSEILAYLLGKAPRIPDCIKHMVVKEGMQNTVREFQDQVAIYKEEVTTILPLTIRKNFNENFGLSKDPSKSDMDREIAIPYIAASTPSEKSRFGNYLETINYTLRAQLYQPSPPEVEMGAKKIRSEIRIFPSEAVIKAMLLHYKNLEDEERKDEKIKNLQRKRPISHKSAGQQFFELMGGRFKLSDIDLEDKGTFDIFYKAVKDIPQVKRHCMLNHVLTNIEKTPTILASDAQNHCSQFRSIRAMTGTDWNYRCYPDYIKIAKSLSLGSDGQTLDLLLRNEQPVNGLASAITAEEKLDAMIDLFSKHPLKKDLHAWIDLGAFFRDVTNTKVAQHLAMYFSSHSDDFAHIKFILFFGPDNKLYAQPRDVKLPPILLEQTDASFIEKKLGWSSAHTFTYYDQRRSTGTDITQAIHARAFISIDEKTLYQAELQAVMRMRGLADKEQVVDFVVPKEVQDAHPEITVWTVEAITNLLKENQIERLAEGDHFRSAIQKLNNTLREDLKAQFDASSPREQNRLMNIDKFRGIFFNEVDKSAFEMFGEVTIEDDTAKVFKRLELQIIENWQTILTQAKMSVSLAEENQFKGKLADIIKRAEPFCSKKVLTGKSSNVLADTQVAYTKEQNRENQQTVETKYQVRADISPIPIKLFNRVNFRPELKVGELGGVAINTLEEMAKGSRLKIQSDEKEEVKTAPWEFSSNIFVTENYQHTYYEENKAVDSCKKEATFFLVQQENKPPGSIQFLLLTMEEAAHMSHNLQSYDQSGSKKIWIESVHSTLRAGEKPSVLHDDYKKGIEQIAFFNADTDILYNNYNKDSWLSEQTPEKIYYLQNVIQPIHKDKKNMLPL